MKPSKRPGKTTMPEIARLAQKENISVSTVSRMFKKMGKIYLRRSRKPLLSVAMIQKGLERSNDMLNNFKNHKNRIFIFFDWENFYRFDPVFNKQNHQGVKFVNDVCKHSIGSTTEHPDSIMILEVVASKEEKMPPVWM